MSDPARTRRIEERAYAIWESEGRPHGRDREHWHKAEAQIAEEEGAEKRAFGAPLPTRAQTGKESAGARNAARRGKRL